jgi:hypothetical protein
MVAASFRECPLNSCKNGWWFGCRADNVVREGSFGSVRELVRAMETYLAERNLAPKRYVWKKKDEEILAKISRARAAQAAVPRL